MSKRLDQQREEKLTPIRMKKAIEEIGKKAIVISSDKTTIVFQYKNELCSYFPYSGWATGKTIKDGRGLKNLLDQLI